MRRIGVGSDVIARHKKGGQMTGKSLRGFAVMDEAKRREIAAKGGASVPADRRAFSKNRELAKAAGAKGGQASRGGGRTASEPEPLP
jgi:general stress protein YciG